MPHLSLLLHPTQINTPSNDYSTYHTLLTFLLFLTLTVIDLSITESTTHHTFGVPLLQFMLLAPASRSYGSPYIPGFVWHHTNHRHNDILMFTIRKAAFYFHLDRSYQPRLTKSLPVTIKYIYIIFLIHNTILFFFRCILPQYYRYPLATSSLYIFFSAHSYHFGTIVPI